MVLVSSILQSVNKKEINKNMMIMSDSIFFVTIE